jgi:hypothetical protein
MKEEEDEENRRTGIERKRRTFFLFSWQMSDELISFPHVVASRNVPANCYSRRHRLAMTYNKEARRQAASNAT